jgi:hypothetical protein
MNYLRLIIRKMKVIILMFSLGFYEYNYEDHDANQAYGTSNPLPQSTLGMHEPVKANTTAHLPRWEYYLYDTYLRQALLHQAMLRATELSLNFVARQDAREIA